MTWTEDEAFAVQQLQEEVRFLKNVIGRWRVNGADSFFQESGFRFGTNFDIGDQGFQIRAPEDTVSIVWLNDFLPAFDATADYPYVKISGTTDPTDADSGTELNLSSWRSATQTSEVGIASDGTTARVQLSATTAAGGNATLEIRAGDGSAGALVRVEESRFRVGVFTSDPSVLTDGEVLYRSDTDKFRGRANGATDNFAMEGWVTSGFVASGTVILGSGSELTIATGAITITSGYHRVDTQSDAASDDLDTISGGTTGQLLVLRAENSARDVVVKNGTGNIQLDGALDFTLDNVEDTVTLIYDGSNWLEVSRSDNGT